MRIDLRSDTVTKPTPEMLEVMLNSKVGDDVFEEDSTVNELEKFASDLFGMDAALFCPSGTMTNQIAIKVQTQPGDEVICEEGAHINYYEGGGIAFNSSASTKVLVGNRGVFTADQVLNCLRPANVHFPNTSLVCVENTCNRGGGKIFPFDELERIKEVCIQHNLSYHLDGARLFNAIADNSVAPKEYGRLFNSISICLSKGLGAPVGSLLLGDKTLINKGRRIRKVLGGGMRQAGYLASAGLYALQNNVARLQQDHELAKAIESLLNSTSFVKEVLPVETNIVVFELDKDKVASDFLSHLAEYEIDAFEVGLQRIRFVTHLDLPKQTLQGLKSAIDSFKAD